MINRILALLIRYQNIAFGSFPRLVSIFYWPTVQILFWGFFTNFFMTNENFGIWSSLNIILSAVVLWDVLFRGQLGLFQLGVFLIFLFFNLIVVGWAVGFIVSGLVLRYGHAFEELAWAIIFIILPFSCVYYPLNSLPEILQGIAQILPTVHIFESMRLLLIEKKILTNDIIKILFLNIIYISLSILFFLKMIKVAREKGLLFNQGE